MIETRHTTRRRKERKQFARKTIEASGLCNTIVMGELYCGLGIHIFE